MLTLLFNWRPWVGGQVVRSSRRKPISSYRIGTRSKNSVRQAKQARFWWFLRKIEEEVSLLVASSLVASSSSQRRKREAHWQGFPTREGTRQSRPMGGTQRTTTQREKERKGSESESGSGVFLRCRKFLQE